jgi:hypothetical protein
MTLAQNRKLNLNINAKLEERQIGEMSYSGSQQSKQPSPNHGMSNQQPASSMRMCLHKHQHAACAVPA